MFLLEVYLLGRWWNQLPLTSIPKEEDNNKISLASFPANIPLKRLNGRSSKDSPLFREDLREILPPSLEPLALHFSSPSTSKLRGSLAELAVRLAVERAEWSELPRFKGGLGLDVT